MFNILSRTLSLSPVASKTQTKVLLMFVHGKRECGAAMASCWKVVHIILSRLWNVNVAKMKREKVIYCMKMMVIQKVLIQSLFKYVISIPSHPAFLASRPFQNIELPRYFVNGNDLFQFEYWALENSSNVILNRARIVWTYLNRLKLDNFVFSRRRVGGSFCAASELKSLIELSKKKWKSNGPSYFWFCPVSISIGTCETLWLHRLYLSQGFRLFCIHFFHSTTCLRLFLLSSFSS